MKIAKYIENRLPQKSHNEKDIVNGKLCDLFQRCYITQIIMTTKRSI